MRVLWLAAALLLVSPVPAAVASQPEKASAGQWDAGAAWDEFEGLLRGAYAYIERDDIDVEAQLERSKTLAKETPDKAAFRRIIHQTALTFMDPHLIVGPFDQSDYSIVMTAADMSARFVDGEAVIEDVRRGSPAFEAGLRPGDMILEIGDKYPNAAAMHPFGPVLVAPTPAQRDYGLTLAVNGTRGFGRRLRVMDSDGSARSVELVSTLDYARSLADRDLVTLRFVGEDDDIAHITVLNSLGNNDTIAAFDAIMEQAAGARAVILDMRETPSGGNTEVARSIIGHFTPVIAPYQMHRIPVFEREYTVPRQFIEYVYPREPQYAGPVFVLHGKWTGSMGEGIVIGMDAATQAISIGSDMGDLLGGLWNRDLRLSGARVDLGGEALFHVDGTPREDYVADYPIMPASTASDGSDPALAEVMRALNSDLSGSK
ncbi:MAG: PDZ domain-containing protein [Pseudomonadota bacterium]